MKTNRHYDVLVVGAGPAGVMAAVEAANAGASMQYLHWRAGRLLSGQSIGTAGRDHVDSECKRYGSILPQVWHWGTCGENLLRNGIRRPQCVKKVRCILANIMKPHACATAEGATPLRRVCMGMESGCVIRCCVRCYRRCSLEEKAAPVQAC